MTKTVAPANMGSRLDWNAGGKKYDVNVDDLLEAIATLTDRVTALENAPTLAPINISAQTADSSTGILQVGNLNTDIAQLGFQPFFGLVRNQSTGVVIWEETGEYYNGYTMPVGVPVKVSDNAEKGEQVDAATQISDLIGIHEYDFTGWQLATQAEVVQMFFHNSQSFIRTNDRGMTADGVFRDVTAWGKWTKI